MINIKMLIELKRYPSEQEITESFEEQHHQLLGKFHSINGFLTVGRVFEDGGRYYEAALCYALAAKRGNIKGYHALITVLDKNEKDSVFCNDRLLTVDVVLCRRQRQELIAGIIRERKAFLKKIAILRRIRDLNYPVQPSLRELFDCVNEVDHKLYNAEWLLDGYQRQLLDMLPGYKNALITTVESSLAELTKGNDIDAAASHEHAVALDKLKAINTINTDNSEEVILLCKKLSRLLKDSLLNSQRILISEIDNTLSGLLALRTEPRSSGAVGALLQMKLAASPLRSVFVKTGSALSILKAKANLLTIHDTDMPLVLSSYRNELNEIFSDMKREKTRGCHQLTSLVDKYYHVENAGITCVRLG